jgi:hypothetical protein
MQRNKLLPYISAVKSVFDDLVVDADTILSDNDDGDERSVAQGKEAAVELVNEAIRQLEKLRLDINGLSYSKFCHKHSVES